MRIKPTLPDLDKFDEAAEKGGDKDLAERLTQLVLNLEHGSVAIFDGRWGIGKTTFVRRWLAHLKSQGIPSIYLDAFSVDYAAVRSNQFKPAVLITFLALLKTVEPSATLL